MNVAKAMICLIGAVVWMKGTGVQDIAQDIAWVGGPVSMPLIHLASDLDERCYEPPADLGLPNRREPGGTR